MRAEWIVTGEDPREPYADAGSPPPASPRLASVLAQDDSTREQVIALLGSKADADVVAALRAMPATPGRTIEDWGVMYFDLRRRRAAMLAAMAHEDAAAGGKSAHAGGATLGSGAEGATKPDDASPRRVAASGAREDAGLSVPASERGKKKPKKK